MVKEIKDLLKRYKIKPDPLMGQYFLADEKILDKIVGLTEVSKKDKVLEIGCGLGTLTKELAKRAKEVHGIEVDKRFLPVLSRMPGNVCIIYGNVWKVLGGRHRPKEHFDKIVSNLPYSLCEPMMHKFTHASFKVMVFMVPRNFAHKVRNHCIFGAFYNITEAFEVPKSAFYPVPKTSSVVLKITSKSDPIKEKDIPIFIRQYLYEHEQALVRNSLREAVIKIFDRFYKKRITKNQAREILAEADISQGLLEKIPDNPEVYFEAAEKLEKVLRETKPQLVSLKA